MRVGWGCGWERQGRGVVGQCGWRTSLLCNSREKSSSVSDVCLCVSVTDALCVYICVEKESVLSVHVTED